MVRVFRGMSVKLQVGVLDPAADQPQRSLNGRRWVSFFGSIRLVDHAREKARPMPI
jgi:hypothetical protein